MFDLYCNTDRFWHEISRTNELCSQRSGSKVRKRIIYLLGLIPDGEEKSCGWRFTGGGFGRKKRQQEKFLHLSRYLWRSFCCATKDKYLIINFACTTPWLYPEALEYLETKKNEEVKTWKCTLTFLLFSSEKLIDGRKKFATNF